jgi:hypothetical protein
MEHQTLNLVALSLYCNLYFRHSNNNINVQLIDVTTCFKFIPPCKYSDFTLIIKGEKITLGANATISGDPG